MPTSSRSRSIISLLEEFAELLNSKPTASEVRLERIHEAGFVTLGDLQRALKLRRDQVLSLVLDGQLPRYSHKDGRYLLWKREAVEHVLGEG